MGEESCFTENSGRGAEATQKEIHFWDYQLPGLPKLHSHSWGKTGRSSSKRSRHQKPRESSKVPWKHKSWAATGSWSGPAAPRWSLHHGWHCNKCPIYPLTAEWGGQDTKLIPVTDWKTTQAPTNKWHVSGHFLQLFLPFQTWKCRSSGYPVI